jgi:hypothetical protein
MSVDGFELAAVDRDARRRQQAHLPAHFNQVHADLLDCSPAILAEVGCRLVVRSEPASQPCHLNIEPGHAQAAGSAEPD